MTTTKRPKRWSYSVGERGRNRVRVFEHQTTGRIFLEFYEPSGPGQRPKPKRVALGHRDRERAKAKAEEVAAKLRQGAPVVSEKVTLGTLFKNYLDEVTPTKAASTRQHDRTAAEMFLRAFGRNREARTLGRQDLERFVRERRSGVLRPKGVKTPRPVGNRQIEYDLKFLQAVLNRATTLSDGRGGMLLDRNPLKGLPLPREESPRRPMLRQEQYEGLLGVAAGVSWQFRLALVLAHETGHRLQSIRLLRWSDIDLEQQRVRWRAENDKIGFEHATALTATACEALRRVQRGAQAIGDTWVFASGRTRGEPTPRSTFLKWWKEAEREAKLPPELRRGFHSLRRKFATELKDVPLKDLAALGGWKGPAVILECYQKPDEETMRQALENRRVIRAVASR